MRNSSGSNFQDIKVRNRLLVLRLIATNQGISRVDLAKMTGLAKMTVGNIASELIASGVVAEAAAAKSVGGNYGRKPIRLKIADDSPCICGMLVKRGLCQIILANLDGGIFEQIDFPFQQLSGQQQLVDLLREGYTALKARTTRRIMAVGISSVGPLDSTNGAILSPPYFYGIENMPITAIVEEIASVPVFLINDANAGAMAENLFGAGKLYTNFLYLHIMNGVGSGLVLHGKLYNGDAGQSGEIGHTSINFSGPRCACGNTGCLDLYASMDRMRERIAEQAALYPASPLAQNPRPGWLEVVDAGNEHDPLALSALDEFCSYIAYSLINTLNILDLSNIVVGYDSRAPGTIIETLLLQKISKAILSSDYRRITVSHSVFGGNAPLVGAIAEVADKVFSMQFPLDEIESMY